MTNVGEETIMENHSAGELQISSKGLSVFVGKEEIQYSEDKWKNASKGFNTLEEAVKDAISRARS